MTRILVVDDHESIRSLLRAALESEGYDVIEAENGDEGLRHYQVEPTDLVITDMQMPGMNGLELIRELQGASPWVKVMAIGGCRRTLTMARTLTPYTLEKPFSLKNQSHY